MAPPRAPMSTVPVPHPSAPAEPPTSGQLALAIHVQVEHHAPAQAEPKPVAKARPRAPVEVALPTTHPLPAPGLPVTLDLGPRKLVATVGPEGACLHDESGARVKSLRKTKLDDPRAFARAKALWVEMRGRGTTDYDLDAAWLYLFEHMLRTGQSATAAELKAAWATPAGPRNLASMVWIALDSGAPVSWDEGELCLAGAPLPDHARVRLAHPARDHGLELGGLQALRASHRPSAPEAVELAPQVGRFRPTTLGRILMGQGFEAVGTAATTWQLLAPELGGIAFIRCDLVVRLSLSFRRWNGTLEGGAPLALAEVDPQLFAEAYEALLAALPSE